MLRQYLHQRYPEETLPTNASRWGADSRWALQHMRSLVLIRQPNVILLEFAINDADVRNRIAVTESEKNIESMIGLAMDSKAACEIWLMTSHVPTGRHKTVRPALADFYEMYISLAIRTNVGLIDLSARWGSGPPEKQYMQDGIHTNVLAAQDIILPTILSHLDL